ncbi:MAG: cysteine--tRNA ligase [Hyphomicrobiales bacterium]|nr:cysteine--tRNA ligase [Hyphomicrobiales bacterium]
MAKDAGPGFRGLRLYNTLTRAKQEFVPLDPANVRMYVCGPTVYDFAHIGNARPIIVFDVLFRLLRHLYGETKVTYVRNITDVDDKIIARAAEEGTSVDEITRRTTKQFHEDVAALGCLEPTHEPRATQHIGEMIAMIERLIANGCAYRADGHVLFDVTKFADYGKLSNRSTDEMIAGARVEVAPYKKNPMDFVLWKPSTPEQPGWDSPWGRGRPGWHLECSAMSEALLGETFDIHGGGIDLVFPHHENEIAQSRCAHGTETMARYWLHNGYLQVEGQKMSKSLGNFVTIRDLLKTDKFGGRKWPGAVLKLAMLMTHYREPIDFTVGRLEDAERIWRRWGRIEKALGEWDWQLVNALKSTPEPQEGILGFLCDDMNTHAAIATMQTLARSAEGGYERAGEILVATAEFLGMELNEAVLLDHVPDIERALIDSLLAARAKARAAKDWAEADRIRDELAEMGIQLKDSKDPETGEMKTEWEVAR